MVFSSEGIYGSKVIIIVQGVVGVRKTGTRASRRDEEVFKARDVSLSKPRKSWRLIF